MWRADVRGFVGRVLRQTRAAADANRCALIASRGCVLADSRRWRSTLAEAASTPAGDAAHEPPDQTAFSAATPVLDIPKSMSPSSKSALLPFLHVALARKEAHRARRIRAVIRSSSSSAAANPKVVLLDDPELDRHVTNSFMDTYLACGGVRNTRAALREWSEMRGRGIQPNLASYAILLRGFMRNHMPSPAWILLKEFQDIASGGAPSAFDGGVHAAFTLDDLFASPYLEPEDVRRLKALATAANGPTIPVEDVIREEKRTEATKSQSSTFTPLTSKITPAELSAVLNTPPQAELPEKPDMAAVALDADKSVEPISTKVLGVKLLKNALSWTILPSTSAQRSPQSLRELQVSLESHAVSSALERLKMLFESPTSSRPITSLPVMRRLVWDWHQRMSRQIREDQSAMLQNLNSHSGTRGRSSEMLLGLDADRVTLTVIHTLLRLLGSQGVVDGTRTTTALAKVGRAIELEYRAEWYHQRKKNKASNTPEPLSHSSQTWPKLKGGAQKLVDELGTNPIASASAAASLTPPINLLSTEERHDHAKRLEQQGGAERWIPEWPLAMRIHIAGHLVAMLMDTAKVLVATPTVAQDGDAVDADANTDEKVEMPALFHSYQFERGIRVGVLRWHEKVLEAMSYGVLDLSIDARYLPMVVPPKPWVTYNKGGYLTHDSVIMRTKHSKQQLEYLKQAANRGQLGTLYQALDVLGSTPWKINRRVFRTVIEAWNSRAKYPSMPPLRPTLKLPPKPEGCDQNRQLQSQWLAESRQMQNEWRNDHSLRCDVNYKVEIARAYLDHELFFPHNVDFRGRAYPIPPLLNHLGSDLCRGLLLFGRGRPLGPSGLNWIKVQIANLYGFDKHSFEDRRKFADEHADDIRASASNPLAPSGQWWLSADDPWQCLAACIEYVEAVDSGNPETYLSHLPIHQDGTCNGLQHYAAIGGDEYGAKHVNLIPGDKPRDIYSEVLRLVQERVHSDALKDIPMAVTLDGRLTRKVIKQTVMTNVYGVTYVGAKDQILNRLREIPELGDEDLVELAHYLTKIVFSSLGKMFSGARALQEWLNQTAGRISHSVPPAAFDEAAPVKPTRRRRPAQEGADSPEQMTKRLLKDVKTEGTEQAELFIDEMNAASKAELKQRKNPLVDSRSAVIWTTPLGLPIVQPYRKDKGRQIRTRVQIVSVRDPDMQAVINTRKQRTAFPPNFIHSLDATHMLMSALECHHHGLTFAAVHDSYWTHASDVATMSRVLREQFIKLHSQPIIDNLVAEFKARYAGYRMPASILETAKAKEIAAPSLDEAVDEDDVATEDSADGSLVEESSHAHSEDHDQPEANTRTRAGKKQWVPVELPPLPPRGNFDIRNVSQSPYFFH